MTEPKVPLAPDIWDATPPEAQTLIAALRERVSGLEARLEQSSSSSSWPSSADTHQASRQRRKQGIDRLSPPRRTRRGQPRPLGHFSVRRNSVLIGFAIIGVLIVIISAYTFRGRIINLVRSGQVSGMAPSVVLPRMATPVPVVLPGRAFFDRKDMLYSSEIGTWRMQDGRFDGHYMLNYNNSCPNCPVLARDAKIAAVKWGAWDTFPEQLNPVGNPGSLSRVQFDNVIDGIINTLQAYPMLKFHPFIPPSQIGMDFCKESWGMDNLEAMNKAIIQQAGNRVGLYELTSEPEHTCGYSLAETGTKSAEYWIGLAPKLKKYARSLGFEIHIGGPGVLTANINNNTNTADLQKAKDFLQEIKREYDDPNSPYFHDPDLIPNFYSFHAYAVEYINMVGGNATVLDAIPAYAKFIDGIQAIVNDTWGPLAPNIKLIISEWNVYGFENEAFASPMTATYYTEFLQMLRSKDVFMATQFLMATNDNNMDMITQKGVGTSYYDAFKQSSLADAIAIKSHEDKIE